MKTSNKILLTAYAVVVLTATVAIFSTKPLIERALLGIGDDQIQLVK